MKSFNILIKSKIITLKKYIYRCSRKYSSNYQIRKLHDDVIKISKKILFDTNIKLADKASEIAYIKFYSFHTNIDQSARQILCISNWLAKASYINYNFWIKLVSILVATNVRSLNHSFISKKFEDDIDFTYKKNVQTKKRCFPKVDIVFVASLSSYLGFILNLAPKLGVSYLILTTNKAKRGVKKSLLNDRVFSIDECLSNELKRELFHIQELSCEYFYSHENLISKTLKLLNVNFFSMYSKSLLNVWKFILPQSVIYYKFMNSIINEVSPKHIIGLRMRRIFERSCYVAARDNGVTTNVVLHSTIGCTIDDYFLTGNFDVIDNAFVWGKAHQEIINSDKISENCKVHVVGSLNLIKKSHKPLKKNNKFKVLYAATRDDEKEIRALVNAIKDIKNVELVIKVHPNKNILEYKNFEKINFVNIEPRKIPIENMMENVDLFVTTYSGSHLYAAVCNIPIILIAFSLVVKDDLFQIYGLDSEHKDVSNFVITREKDLFNSINTLEKRVSNLTKKRMLSQMRYINNLVKVRTSSKDILNNIKEILLI